MSQAGSNNGSHHHINRQGVHIAGGLALLLKHVIQNLLADEESRGEEHSITTTRQSEGADGNYLGLPFQMI